MAKNKLTTAIETLQEIDSDVLNDTLLEIVFYHSEVKQDPIKAYAFLKFLVKTYEQWWCAEHADPDVYEEFEKQKDYID